ncbi:hypothetical protein ANCCAN_01310 [Ancylostoma caninum]|uniref:BAR domain-containing protein n=1 Tax=Ancylostoma caninum TaxID=29170 RepID=A0A368H7M9_ANCCA|nr:hypothetical protein ANCCAN_01310 [Ancylostoma caninum]
MFLSVFRMSMTLGLGTLSSANQTVFDELSDFAKKKVPHDVHTQLTTEFVPAVKEVAKAGAELLKVYQALQKSSDQYLNALRTLVRSSKKAYPGAKGQGDGLNDLVTQYSGIVDQHKKCARKCDVERQFQVSEFASIVSKTMLYGNEEKEKLREIFNKFQKEEKTIENQRKKGTKTQSDVQTFVNDSAKLFLQQQEMRYRFFYEKHRSWFLTYSKLIPQMDNFSLGRRSQLASADDAERLSAIHPISESMTKPVHTRVDSVYSNATRQPSRKPTVQQENSAEINAVEIVKPPSTSVPEATTEVVVARRTMEATAAPVVVADRRQAPIDPAPVVHRESPILAQTPEQYLPSEWNNKVLEIREYDPVSD